MGDRTQKAISSGIVDHLALLVSRLEPYTEAYGMTPTHVPRDLVDALISAVRVLRSGEDQPRRGTFTVTRVEGGVLLDDPSGVCTFDAPRPLTDLVYRTNEATTCGDPAGHATHESLRDGFYTCGCRSTIDVSPENLGSSSEHRFSSQPCNVCGEPVRCEKRWYHWHEIKAAELRRESPIPTGIDEELAMRQGWVDEAWNNAIDAAIQVCIEARPFDRGTASDWRCINGTREHIISKIRDLRLAKAIPEEKP